MIKYRLYAPNDGDTMTVDGGGGGGWVSNDDRKDGNDRNNDKGGSAVNLSKNPEKQAILLLNCFHLYKSHIRTGVLLAMNVPITPHQLTSFSC
ncbi:hypothetical protein [Pectobacterium aquaticum]|uniref:hypothetical protein n=1 Tax=Pectobacterium aquaticum TaxID=2204145 RepID=UPI001F11081F|nr:hypothetical protein [Pectobacterium aquaticum]MCH5051083.1 hypothetical protein [Pectobacterium aquaticum]